jgi:hypothetical protein
LLHLIKLIKMAEPGQYAHVQALNTADRPLNDQEGRRIRIANVGESAKSREQEQQRRWHSSAAVDAHDIHNKGDNCAHAMLLPLNKHTLDNLRLQADIWGALQAGMPLVLLHMQDEACDAVPFHTFFDQCPTHLKDAGLFDDLACSWYFDAPQVDVACKAVGLKLPGAMRLNPGVPGGVAVDKSRTKPVANWAMAARKLSLIGPSSESKATSPAILSMKDKIKRKGSIHAKTPIHPTDEDDAGSRPSSPAVANRSLHPEVMNTGVHELAHNTGSGDGDAESGGGKHTSGGGGGHGNGDASPLRSPIPSHAGSPEQQQEEEEQQRTVVPSTSEDTLQSANNPTAKENRGHKSGLTVEFMSSLGLELEPKDLEELQLDGALDSAAYERRDDDKLSSDDDL